MKNTVKYLILILLFPLTSFASVWTATNTWNQDWENKFSNWIENDVEMNIFIQGDWANTVADCTDTTYILRVIFAYQNSLPVHFHLDDDTIVTNDSTAYDSVQDPKARVHKFYAMLADRTDSSTVYKDSYPVAINRQALHPGIMDVHRPFPGQGGSGHSQYIRTIKDNGVIGYIWNSVPPAVRMLSLSFGVSYVPRSDTPQAGFRHWIWPQDEGKEESTLPDYSLEQYSMGLDNAYSPPSYDLQYFSNAVVARLKIRDLSNQEILDMYVPSICSYITLRAEVVKRAQEAQIASGGACFDAADFDNYSTYSRDARLVDMFNDLFGQFKTQSAPDQPFQAPVVEQAIDAACPLTSFDAANSITTYQFLNFLSFNMASSNPNDSYWARWGYNTPRNTTCPVYQ